MSEDAPRSLRSRLVTLTCIVMVAFGFGVTVSMWAHLPEGQGLFSFAVFGPRIGYYFALILSALLLFGGLPLARRRGGKTGEIVVVWAIVVLVASHLLVLFNRTHRLTNYTETVPVLAAVAYVGFGVTLATLEPGSPFGMRFAWLLASERSWRLAHRFMGLCFVAAGAACGAVSVVDPARGFGIVVAAPVMSLTLGVVFSLLFARKKPDEGSEAEERPNHTEGIP